jgi:hypothetical protein
VPLSTRFYPYQPNRPPDAVGVYELAWTDAIVYIGMGKIACRVQFHHRDQTKTWNRYRCIITNDRRRAGQIERRELRQFRSQHGRLPRYNHQIG